MKAEALLQKPLVRESIRKHSKAGRSRKSPEQVLCDVLNRFGPQQRRAIAQVLR